MKDVLLLSILQGVAEFLPISSSGHLVLGKHFLGMGDVGMRLDIFLHVGTLVAVFAFYWAVVWRIVRELDWVYALKIVLSAVPAGIVGVLFKNQLESAFAAPKMVGFALMFTGIVLTLTRFLPKGEKDVSFGGALWMGLAQAVAILPGVSRSGMTLTAARAVHVDAKKSAEFSFLMSAPPIAGAALLDVLKMFKEAPGATEGTLETPWGLVAVGCVVSAIVGYFSLKLLVSSLQGRWFWLFGPYCLCAGLLAVILI